MATETKDISKIPPTQHRHFQMNHQNMNHQNIGINSNFNSHATLVDLQNIHLGMIVKRGRDWNNRKWRDDIDRNSTTIPKTHLSGEIIGFTNAQGALIGENTNRDYNRIHDSQGPGWCCVRWSNGNESVYPVGAEHIYSLSFV